MGGCSWTLTELLEERELSNWFTLLDETKSREINVVSTEDDLVEASMNDSKPEGKRSGLFGGGKTMKVHVTNMDAILVICNTGLQRENTRDEIYCQICKQLVNNPNRYSHARAWILLALCSGVFLPSPRFETVLRHFIKNNGPPGYLPFVMRRFARAETAYQPRLQPPCSLEVHSAFTGKPIQIRVYFYFTSIVVLADAATTPAEVMESVQRHPDISEEYGFKLFVLGKEALQRGTKIKTMKAFDSSDSHVMDPISEFEDIDGKGKEWTDLYENTPWRVVLRKQAFTPWLEGIDNLELIYQQIWDGMERGLYQSTDTKELANNLAIRYFVKVGSEINRNVLVNQLEAEPVGGMEVMQTNEWAQLVTDAFVKRDFRKRHATATDLKVEIVEFARNTWKREFSLPYLGCTVVSGGRDLTDVTVLVNSDGVIVTREVITYNGESAAASNRDGFGNDVGGGSEGNTPRDIHTIPFDQMLWLSRCRESDVHEGKDAFRLIAINDDGVSKVEIEIASAQAMLIQKNISECFKGVKFRSKYVITTLANTVSVGDDSLQFDKADLILLESVFVDSSSKKAFGYSEKTKRKGAFPSDKVFVIPSLVRPTDELIALYADASKAGVLDNIPDEEPEEDDENLDGLSVDLGQGDGVINPHF